MVASRVALSPTGVCTAKAATTPSAESAAPARTTGRDTASATTSEVTVACTASARLMFIQPPSPNRTAITTSGTAAPPTSRMPDRHRPAIASATPASPRNRPATGLVAAASSAQARAPAMRSQRQQGEQPQRDAEREGHPPRHEVADEAHRTEHPAEQRPARSGPDEQGGQRHRRDSSRERPGEPRAQHSHHRRRDHTVSILDSPAVPAQVDRAPPVLPNEVRAGDLRGQVGPQWRRQQERDRQRGRDQARRGDRPMPHRKSARPPAGPAAPYADSGRGTRPDPRRPGGPAPGPRPRGPVRGAGAGPRRGRARASTRCERTMPRPTPPTAPRRPPG